MKIEREGKVTVVFGPMACGKTRWINEERERLEAEGKTVAVLDEATETKQSIARYVSDPEIDAIFLERRP